MTGLSLILSILLLAQLLALGLCEDEAPKEAAVSREKRSDTLQFDGKQYIRLPLQRRVSPKFVHSFVGKRGGRAPGIRGYPSRQNTAAAAAEQAMEEMAVRRLLLSENAGNDDMDIAESLVLAGIIGRRLSKLADAADNGEEQNSPLPYSSPLTPGPLPISFQNLVSSPNSDNPLLDDLSDEPKDEVQFPSNIEDAFNQDDFSPVDSIPSDRKEAFQGFEPDSVDKRQSFGHSFVGRRSSNFNHAFVGKRPKFAHSFVGKRQGFRHSFVGKRQGFSHSFVGKRQGFGHSFVGKRPKGFNHSFVGKRSLAQIIRKRRSAKSDTDVSELNLSLVGKKPLGETPRTRRSVEVDQEKRAPGFSHSFVGKREPGFRHAFVGKRGPGFSHSFVGKREPGFRHAFVGKREPGFRHAFVGKREPGFSHAFVGKREPGFSHSFVGKREPGFSHAFVGKREPGFSHSFVGKREPGFSHAFVGKREPGFRHAFVGKRAPGFSHSFVGKREPGFSHAFVGKREPGFRHAFVGKREGLFSSDVYPEISVFEPGLLEAPLSENLLSRDLILDLQHKDELLSASMDEGNKEKSDDVKEDTDEVERQKTQQGSQETENETHTTGNSPVAT